MPKPKPRRLVIDTNLWISFLITQKWHVLDDWLIAGRVVVLFSKELIDEINTTVKKPGLKKYFRADAVTEMLSVFEPYSELVEVHSSVTLCRDPNDDFLLALSRDGQADYLLTGDKALLEIGQFGKTRITTIAAFMTIFELSL